MKRTLLTALGLAAAFSLGYFFKPLFTKPPKAVEHTDSTKASTLGAFSLSLSVKNLDSAKLFYEKLGFRSNGGEIKDHYLIMKNGNALIGIFEGMFEGNMLTFNPGWDENAKPITPFEDVRKLQHRLKAQHTVFMNEADEKTTGPAYVMLKDPDGNVILVDQHTK